MQSVNKKIFFSLLIFGCSFLIFGTEKVQATVNCTDDSECAAGNSCISSSCKPTPPAAPAPAPAPAAPAVGAAVAPPAPDPQVVSLQNPLNGNVTDAAVLIGMIIKAALSIVGALSLGVFVIGGFTWLTSAGNQEKVSKGTKTMLWATIGLIVVFASYAAVSLLFTV